jgi:predicted alpha/beta-fold hydrolase
MKAFKPHRLLRQRDVMTVASALWRRTYPALAPAEDRFFEVIPGTKILGKCHWQAERRSAPTIVLVHGLEGSSESGYMLGIANLAFTAGFNAIRLNQRNCGGTEALTSTIYNSGLSGDFRFALEELIARDGLTQIFFCGYSMGGNLVLKMAGELGTAAPPEFRGVAAVAPIIEISDCVDALDLPRNLLYQRHFVHGLKQRVLRKVALFPEIYSFDAAGRVRSVREFDDVFTAKHSGYRDAAEYYQKCSAARVIDRIAVPALIIYAEDDPFVPAEIFDAPAVRENRNITLLSAAEGGHCAFISGDREERHWAEARVVEFARELLERSKALEPCLPAGGH